MDHFPREVVALLPAAKARASSSVWKLLSSGEHQAGAAAGQAVRCWSLAPRGCLASGTPGCCGRRTPHTRRVAGAGACHWQAAGMPGTFSLHGGTRAQTWSWGVGTLGSSGQQGRQPAFTQQGRTVCAPCGACSWPGDASGLVFSTNIWGADTFCRDRGGGLLWG